MEGVRQREESVADRRRQDRARHLPLALSLGLLVGGGLDSLTAMTSQGPHGGDVEGHEGHQGDVGHENGRGRAEAVSHVRAGLVQVRVQRQVHSAAHA